MFKKSHKKNYLLINELIIKGMQKRRRLAALAISKISDNKGYIKVVK